VASGVLLLTLVGVGQGKAAVDHDHIGVIEVLGQPGGSY
jgi:hypothetical protein